MIKIKQIKILDGFKISLVFENNEKKIFNLSPYLEKGVFQELKNPSYLKKVKNEGFFISWPHEQDLSSDTLYLEGRSTDKTK